MSMSMTVCDGWLASPSFVDHGFRALGFHVPARLVVVVFDSLLFVSTFIGPVLSRRSLSLE